jgi:hypothetical protein
MLTVTIVAAVLVTVTAAMHVAGFSIMLRTIFRLNEAAPTRWLAIYWRILRVAWFLLFVHLLEIGVWALFYSFEQCFPNAETAFYFSAVTYTSVGFGDVLLPIGWRVLAPIESLTGILMCGLSASAFFALVNRIVKARTAAKQESLNPGFIGIFRPAGGK